jgi:hypothetical protein
MGSLDRSADGRRLAFGTSLGRGRSSTDDVGSTDLAAGRSELLFVGDACGGRDASTSG